MLFNMKGRPLIALRVFPSLKTSPSIILRGFLVLMFGTFGVCVKTTEEINERPSYVHGRVLPVLASTVGACVLVIRVLPVLASTVLVYL